MQVVLGSRGDYAARAILYLTRHPGRSRRHDIAEAMDIPDLYLPKVLGALVRAGIVRSVVGRRGGYELARPASAITLREVVEVAEGPIDASKCLLRGGPCHWDEQCAFHDAWSAAQRALTAELAATTFAQIAARDRELERTSTVDPAGPRRAHRPRVHEA